MKPTHPLLARILPFLMIAFMIAIFIFGFFIFFYLFIVILIVGLIAFAVQTLREKFFGHQKNNADIKTHISVKKEGRLIEHEDE